MTETPAEQDPRINDAAARLVAAAGRIGLDPTPILSDARHRKLCRALIDAGVLTDDAVVDLEVAAIEETIEQTDAVTREVESQARRATLLEGVHKGPNGHGR